MVDPQRGGGGSIVWTNVGVDGDALDSSYKALRQEGMAAYSRADELHARGSEEAAAVYVEAGRRFRAAADAAAAGEHAAGRVPGIFGLAIRAYGQAREVTPRDPPCSAPVRDLLREMIEVAGAAEAAVPAAPAEFAALRLAATEDLAGCGSAPEAVAAAPPDESPQSDRPRKYTHTAGLITAGALTAALGAVALGTGLATLKKPFAGVAYTNIHAAAVATFAMDASFYGEVNTLKQSAEANVNVSSSSSSVRDEFRSSVDSAVDQQVSNTDAYRKVSQRRGHGRSRSRPRRDAPRNTASQIPRARRSPT